MSTGKKILLIPLGLLFLLFIFVTFNNGTSSIQSFRKATLISKQPAHHGHSDNKEPTEPTSISKETVSALRWKRLLEKREEEEMENPSILVFLHVPKAAGSTMEHLIANIVMRMVPASVPMMCPHNCNFLEMSVEMQEKVYIIAGHRGYGVHKQVGFEMPIELYDRRQKREPTPGKRQLKYFTILREPISRTISQYFYWKSRAQEREEGGGHFEDSEEYFSSNVTFIEWLDHFKSKANSPWKANNNPMTYQMAHYWAPPRFVLERALMENRRRKLDHEDLMIAQENLASFAAIGIAERMSETIHLLDYTFGWMVPEEVPKLNRRGHYAEQDGPIIEEEEEEEDFNEKISDEEIQYLRPLIQHDIALYEFGVGLFEQQLKEIKYH